MIVDALLLLGHEAILEGTVIDIGVFGKVGVDWLAAELMVYNHPS